VGYQHNRQRCDGYISNLSNVGYQRHDGYDSVNCKRFK
jgi:hypothetical protein